MDASQSNAFQQAVLQMRRTYLGELPEKLDKLEALLLEIEKSGASRDEFDELYRIVHSMKGSGGTFGLHILTTICHQLEDLLSTTDGGANLSKELIAPSLNYVDLLRMATEQCQSGNETFPQIEEHLSVLRKQLVPKQFTILLIDNSKLSTKLYLRLLSDLPVNTVVMNDGPNALMRALTEPFDLIISTYEIPVLNGTALIGAVKLSDTKSRSAKTILITSNKQLATTRNRSTDPDHTIIKDAKLAQNLIEKVKYALAIVKGCEINRRVEELQVNTSKMRQPPYCQFDDINPDNVPRYPAQCLPK